MRQTTYLIVAFLLLALLAAGVGYQQYNSTEAVRGRLLDDFVACVPDSVGTDGLDEIRSLFDGSDIDC